MADIEKVTFQDAAEKLRDSIRSAFVEIIPEDQWKDMVRKELEKFFDPPTREDFYYKTKVPTGEASLFHKMVREEFEKECRRRIAEVVHLGFWRPDKGSLWAYKHFSARVETMVKEWLSENADKLVWMLVSEMIGGAASAIMSNVAAGYQTLKDYNHDPVDYNDYNDPRNPASPRYRGY